MSKKIDERLPLDTGKGLLPDCPVMKSPWDKTIGYKESIITISMAAMAGMAFFTTTCGTEPLEKASVECS